MLGGEDSCVMFSHFAEVTDGLTDRITPAYSARRGKADKIESELFGKKCAEMASMRMLIGQWLMA